MKEEYNFGTTWIPFRGIRLVEQTERNFRRSESVLKKKTSDYNSRAF